MSKISRKKFIELINSNIPDKFEYSEEHSSTECLVFLKKDMKGKTIDTTYFDYNNGCVDLLIFRLMSWHRDIIHEEIMTTLNNYSLINSWVNSLNPEAYDSIFNKK